MINAWPLSSPFYYRNSHQFRKCAIDYIVKERDLLNFRFIPEFIKIENNFFKS